MKTKKIIFSLLLGAIVILPSLTSAAEPLKKYTLLEPLPLGEGGALRTEADLSTYLSDMFRLLIIFAGALAVFRLIYAGVIYMSTDAFGKKSEAKKIIQETLGGLALVLGSWIIVATIFSGTDAVKDGAFTIDLSIPKILIPENTNPPTGEGTGGGGRVLPYYELTPEKLAQDTAIRTELNPVTVNNGPCTEGKVIGCTNVYGMPQRTRSGLKSLASACACAIEITGGTEGGHVTHGPAKPAVDLSPTSALNTYLVKTNPKAASPIEPTNSVKACALSWSVAVALV